MLINGAWKNKKFKPYNFAALGATLEVGHLHPLLKVRSEFRKIFLEMGYVKEKIIFKYIFLFIKLFFLFKYILIFVACIQYFFLIYFFTF